jgi:hypothetical protein
MTASTLMRSLPRSAACSRKRLCKIGRLRPEVVNSFPKIC